MFPDDFEDIIKRRMQGIGDKIMKSVHKSLQIRSEFNSVKTRLILVFLCVSLIPIAVITATNYVINRRVLKRDTLNWLTAIAESRRAHLLASLETQRGRTIDFASDGLIRDKLEEIVRGVTPANDTVITLNNHLSRNKKPLDPHIIALAVTNKNGVVVAATNDALIGQDMSEEEMFLHPMRMNKDGAYIGQPVHLPSLKGDCIPFSAIITSASTLEEIGVFINFQTPALLSEITTNRAGMGKTGEVYLVNKDKVMLTESRFLEGAHLNQVVDTAPVRKIVEEGQEMAGVYPDYRGVPIVGASVYVPEYGWILLAEIDKSEAFALIKMSGLIALVIGFIALVAVSYLAFIFAVSIAKPINKLTFATRNFKGGDLTQRAEVSGNDEIGHLAASFNDMANELEKTTIERKQADRRRNTQYAIARVLAEETEPEEASTQILQGICETLEWGVGEIWVFDDKVNALRCEKFWHDPSLEIPEFKKITKELTYARGVGLPGFVWDKAKPVCVPDIVHDSNFPRAGIAAREGLHGAFGFPIMYGTERLGVMAFFSHNIQEPNRDLLEMMGAIGGQVGQFMKRKRAEEALKKTVAERDKGFDELRHVMDFSTIVSEQRSEEEMIEYVSSFLQSFFNIDTLGLLMLNIKGKELEVRFIDPPIPTEKLIRKETLLNPLTCHVMKTGNECVVKDVSKEPHCDCLLCDITEGGHACFPLAAGGKTIGVVLMIKKERDFWSNEEIRSLISTYLRIAVSVIQRVRLLEISRIASITDGLTGIYNRRFFNEMLGNQIARAKRYKEPLSLVIADIDHFKKLNDTYGHVAGDLVLQQATKLMGSSLRSSDTLARYGGEEFVIIMPKTDKANAAEKAEAIRRSMESFNFDNGLQGQSIKTTVSIGVASFPEQGTNHDTLVRTADEALYKAKNAGRNRVEA